MYEVEIKVPADHEPLRSRLNDQDVVSLETVEQHDTYYSAPHREFEATDEALRIRTETATTAQRTTHRLTYKGPRIEADSKTRIEHETPIEEPDTVDAILTALGFVAAATVEKTRERYEYDEFLLTLDSVAELGEFLEIETEVESKAAVPPARDAAFDVCRSLGLNPDDQLTTSYLGLLK